MEKWDILDADGNPTGRRTERGAGCLLSGEYHLVVHIWIVSSSGKLLIQRRSKRKRFMPGEWAATGGAAIAGETSLVAARRELYEELGIHTAPDNLKFIKRMRRRSSFVDIWVVHSDTPVSRLRLQRSEVSAVRWVTPDELRSMLINGHYHNYGKEYFDTVFEATKRINVNE